MNYDYEIMIQLLLWSFWLNLFFFSLTIGIETIEVFQDTGDNVTLHCPKQNNAAIQWVVSDVNVNKDLGSKVQDDGSLWIRNAIASDSHLYTCQDSETNQSLGQIKLTVRTVPPSVSNLTIITHSVYALVTWTIHGDGGYPINRFILKYRPSEIRNNDTVLSQWKSLNVDPKTTSVTIYQLQPNRTYYFRLFSVNQIGASQEVTVMAKTKFDLTEIKQANELLSAEQHESSQLFVRYFSPLICSILQVSQNFFFLFHQRRKKFVNVC